MKTSCSHCGGQIEYEQASAGLEVACPHCSKTTRLAVYGAAGSASAPPPMAPAAPSVSQRKKKSGCMIAAIICGVLLLFVVLVIGILAAIAVPNFKKAREASMRAACIANLRTIDGAKATWALEQKKVLTDLPTENDLFGPTLYIREKPACPAGGTYTLNIVDLKPTCTIRGHSF
jgi:competence protein ComGC